MLVRYEFRCRTWGPGREGEKEVKEKPDELELMGRRRIRGLIEVIKKAPRHLPHQEGVRAFKSQ